MPIKVAERSILDQYELNCSVCLLLLEWEKIDGNLDGNCNDDDDAFLCDFSALQSSSIIFSKFSSLDSQTIFFLTMTSINYSELTSLDNKKITHYFQSLLATSSVTVATKYVLDGIERGSILPYLAAIWLRVAKSSEATKLTIEQTFSVQARRNALLYLRQLLRSTGSPSAWDDFGGTKQILRLFNHLSVHDVKILSKALRSAIRSTSTHLTQCLEDLYTSLLAANGPETRLLSTLHSIMLPACSDKFVRDKLAKDTEFSPSSTRLFISRHTSICRQRVIDSLYNVSEDLPPYAMALLHQFPSGPRDASGLTPSMAFSMDILRRISGLQDPPVKTTISHTFVFIDVVMALARRVFRKRGKIEQHKVMEEILEHTIACINRHPDASKNFLFDSRQQLGWLLVKYWSKMPSTYEKYLCKIFEAQQLIPKYVIEKHKQSFQAVPAVHRDQLLRLILKCAQPKSIDLDSSSNLGSLRTIGWPLWLLAV